MARIRSVHPSLFTDEAWVACSPLARILYVGLMTEADDQGLFEWKPLQLKMRLLPIDNADIPALLGELVEVNLICEVNSAGKKLGAIRYFRRFQRPKKPNAQFVLPAEFRTYVGLSADGSELSDDEADQVLPKEELRPQMEDGGGRKENPPIPPGGGVSDAIFDQAVAAYPEDGKVNLSREAMWTAWCEALAQPGAPSEAQLAAAVKALARTRYIKGGGKPKRFDRWLASKGYEAQLEKAPIAAEDRPQWPGPTEIREIVGETFALKYLDACGWDEERGVILAPREFTVAQFNQLGAAVRRRLAEAGVHEVRVQERAA